MVAHGPYRWVRNPICLAALLRRRFGRAYLAYRTAVPRWIPRRPPG